MRPFDAGSRVTCVSRHNWCPMCRLVAWGCVVLGTGVEHLDAEAQSIMEEEPRTGASGVRRRVFLARDFIPHDWLFQKCSIVVCHGGAGTVHRAIRRGCAVVVSPALPDESDQPWWGGCVERQGLGIMVQDALNHKSGTTVHHLFYMKSCCTESTIVCVCVGGLVVRDYARCGRLLG